ncbi:hypothetical protein V1514DRAFT_330387 [Lipomyces japonicus]|uniref:uncharacterized protein n=1 Tax=Lipomyces japonicus TaxID=56871 RepID=UPI0034CD0612
MYQHFFLSIVIYYFIFIFIFAVPVYTVLANNQNNTFNRSTVSAGRGFILDRFIYTRNPEPFYTIIRRFFVSRSY